MNAICGHDIREWQQDPRLLWVPWIGHLFHLSPADMFDITLTQYLEMHDSKGGFGDGS